MSLSTSWLVDHYLDTARRAQNSVVAFIARTLRKSLPQSLAALSERLDKHPQYLPTTLRSLITTYWSESGRSLKGYRDLSQHHAVVSADIRVLGAQDGRRYLFLVLPSDPFENSLRLLRYDSPYVSALGSCRNSFLRLFIFLYETLHLLERFLGTPEVFSMIWHLKDPVTSPIKGGYYMPLPPTLDDMLWRAREITKEAATVRYGELQATPLPMDAA